MRATKLLLVPFVLGMAQPSASLPFASGERLVYNAHAGPGLNARAEMWVEGPSTVRGVRVMVLNSEVKGGFGPFKVHNRSTSWLDPDRMAILRFSRDERSPLGSSSEDVEIDPEEGAWRAADGRAGMSASDQPLDELSFIYMVRTLRLPEDSTVVVNRHFDPDRNPTRITFLGAGTVKIEGRTYATVDVEIRVRDAHRYQGEGIIRISLSDDACRRPVRIESRIPKAGKVVMELLSAEPEMTGCGPR